MEEFAVKATAIILRRMKLPVYEELTLNSFSPDSLRERLARYNAGKCPLYLVLGGDDLEAINSRLDTLYLEMKNLGISTTVPYPIYIVNPTLAFHPHFIVVESVDALPKHFKRPSKRLNNKELAKLSKSDLLADKIVNSSPESIVDSLKERTKKMRLVRKLSKEALFLEALSKELSPPTK